ncbi:MAG TPA: hypothetical protein QF753_10320 [Victivallales bacterium]|nr:hypothetical protein [Victivallales bacterium]
MEALAQQYLSHLGYYLPGYQKGFISGIIALIIVFIIIRIIIALCKPNRKKCSGINTISDNGELHVSSAAISDLIKALEGDIEGITVIRTGLYKYKKEYYIKIIADLDNKDANFPDLVNAIQGKILEAVKTNLGIECIQKIDVHLKRVKSTY